MATAPLISLRGLTKRFGDVVAVDRVDLDLHPGHIHILLGENGAGKSTLMSMLAGLTPPDAGHIAIEGQPVSFRSPRDAQAAGIGMIHQRFMLVPTLSVAENVLLGAATIPWVLRKHALVATVQAQADALGLELDAAAQVGTLTVGQQQRVEILRALSRGARVMILDEPTAVLAPAEVDALFSSLRRLAREGSALVLISHKLQEVREVGDTLTVMRRGRQVARLDDPGARSDEELASLMVGRAVSLSLEREARPPGEPLLVVAGLKVDDDRGLRMVQGVDLTACAGEIVGLAGISGNGQRELLEAVAGVRPAVTGAVVLGGQDVTGRSARYRAALGLRFIPEDRHAVGTAPSLSVAENLALRRYTTPPARRGPWLRLEALRPFCRERVEALQIAATSLDQPAGLLSGGNLQKVILGRELTDEARVILAMVPTRGLDAWAMTEVRRLLLAARQRGAAVLLWSEDLDELYALADRIAVIAAGRVVREGPAEALSRVEVGALMTG